MYYKRLAYKENMNLLNNFWKRCIFSEFAALSLSRRWQHWSNRPLVTKVEQTQRSEVRGLVELPSTCVCSSLVQVHKLHLRDAE